MKRALAPAVIVALVALATPALADSATDIERAREAYDRGVEAQKRGEAQRAAEEFARADAFVPNPAALQAALKAAVDADAVALGAELLERSKREPAPPGLASSISAAHAKFDGRAGKIRIACPPQATCSATIDQAPAPVDKVTWTGVGQHTISVSVDGAAPQTKVVQVAADQTVEFAAVKSGELTSAPPVAAASTALAPPREKEGGGVSRVVVYAGVGVTLALAGVATFFMVQTSRTHEDFESKGCARAGNAECNNLSDDGKSSQTFANVALVSTAAVALVTAVIAVGFTDWKGGRHGGLTRPGGFAITF